MKRIQLVLALSLFLGLHQEANAQGVADPLTIQGMDNFLDIGATSRAMGGVHMGRHNDASRLFYNPAALTGVGSPEVRVGLLFRDETISQRQEWMPNRLQGELSLIFESHEAATEGPFDEIGPNWERSRTSATPAVLAVAVPTQVSGMGITVGLGYAEMIDLNHYFQNNNVLDPHIGALRPEPVPRVQEGDSIMVQWYQFAREREGHIYAITPAVAVQLTPQFSVGANFNLLNGSSDDLQQRRERGLITLKHNNRFEIGPAVYSEVHEGTSSYSGSYFMLSGQFVDQYFSVGVTVRPGFSISREWSNTIQRSDGGGPGSESGTDQVKYPLQVNTGISITPTPQWELVANYDVRRLSGTSYTTGADAVSEPWLGGDVLRVGASFQPTRVVTLRAGYQEREQSFAPEGAGLLDHAARTTVLSGGVGVLAGRIGVDLSLEHSTLSYQDRWLSNVNHNRISQTAVFVETSYNF